MLSAFEFLMRSAYRICQPFQLPTKREIWRGFDKAQRSVPKYNATGKLSTNENTFLAGFLVIVTGASLALAGSDSLLGKACLS